LFFVIGQNKTTTTTTTMPPSEWVVCKFGGTSVSSLKTWKVIADRARTLRQQGLKVCIVVSAVSQVTNHLEKVVLGLENEVSSTENTKGMRRMFPSSEALSTQGQPQNSEFATRDALEWINQRHKRHCEELNIDFGLVQPFLDELERLVEGIRLTGDVASARLKARVLGFGEIISSHIGECLLRRELGQDVRVGLVDARDVFVASDRSASAGELGRMSNEDKYLNADVEPFCLELDVSSKLTDAEGLLQETSSFASGSVQPDNRSLLFAGKDVVITQGFIARTADGQSCVLGRGGSDTSGALFASALSAKRYEIWTDVNGMFSSDPRYVPKAHLISELSYREAQELAAMGAKVLHPRCLGPASWAGVPVQIHNTMGDSDERTRIMSPETLTDGSGSSVMAIVRRTNQVLITISTVDMWGESGFLSRTFAPFEHLGISVDLIATSQYAVSMTLDYIPGGVNGEAFRTLMGALRRQGRVDVKTNCAVVSIVGRKLRSVLHGMADAFKQLERFDVLLLSESTEDLNMSFVLGDAESVDDLALTLHQVLLEKDYIMSASVATRTKELLSPASAIPNSSSPLRGIPPETVVTANHTKTISPVTWWKEEVAKYAHIEQPYTIIDLGTLTVAASKITIYPLSWSEHPAVLRTVFQTNPKVLFLCRSVDQVLSLVAIVGQSINVKLIGTAGATATLPKGVTLETKAINEDKLLKSLNALGACRIAVCSASEVDKSGAAVVDIWFHTMPKHKLTLLSDVPSTLQKVQSLSLCGDHLETLFLLENSVNRVEPTAYPSQLVICGAPSSPFNSLTRSPVHEYIRYSTSN